jgi:molybdate-binding protein
LGLRATAETLGMGFVPCGTERVTVVADETRADKDGVKGLAAALEGNDAIFESLAGYRR